MHMLTLQQEKNIGHLGFIKKKKYKMYYYYFYIFTMTQGNVGSWSAGGYVLAKKLINILVIAALTRHEHSVLITAKNGFLSSEEFLIGCQNAQSVIRTN